MFSGAGPQLIVRVEEAVARLRAGQVLALPTETVYGLAARADRPEAVDRIFALKGRPATNPLIVHVADLTMLEPWTAALEPRARKLAQAFWPGPLTLVLPAREEVSRRITAGQATVALRLPGHPMMQEVIRALGVAVVAPSANRSTRVSPTRAVHVLDQFSGEDLAVLDGGACAVGLESTIVAVLPDETLRLLRPGLLTAPALAAVAGEPVLEGDGALVRAPGQLSLHYAPNVPVRLVETPTESDLRDSGVGWLTPGLALSATGPVQDLGSDAVTYARALYDALHTMDGKGLRVLHVLMPPRGGAWDAVHDRLRRAAAPRKDSRSAGP